MLPRLLVRPIASARLLARYSSTLRRLRPPNSSAIGFFSRSDDNKPTVFVTGFLTDTTTDSTYSDWLASQRNLATSLGWSEEAYAIDWRTGAAGDRFGRYPIPLLAVMLLRGSSLPLFAAGLAGDAMLNATRLYLSYLTAVDASNRDAPKVADAIATSSLTRDYRIVAHSLGCRLIVDALPLLPPESRPSEIHLCAAALTANHALPKLDSICRPGGRIYHYWSSHDEALSSAFLLASRGEPALGSMPLPNEDKPLTISTSSHDVSSYLGLASHGTYRLHFDEFAADAILGRPPPPPLAPWLVRQQAVLGESLTKALKRLPKVSASAMASALPSAGVYTKGLESWRGWLLRRRHL